MPALTENTKTNEDLPAHSWPGGYPIIYLDAGNNTLCSDCATTGKNDGEAMIPHIHYEGSPIYCEECNKTIESAYGEVE